MKKLKLINNNNLQKKNKLMKSIKNIQKVFHYFKSSKNKKVKIKLKEQNMSKNF
jgi:hypothetical protein